MFAVTKAGHSIEFEIKISRSDFLKDREKQVVIGRRVRSKHDILADKESTEGPRRFFYVAPKGMLKLDEIPAWAGLIEVVGLHRTPVIVKAAPFRSKVDKVSNTVKEKIRRGMYWRYWHLRVALARKDIPLDEFDEANTAWLEEANESTNGTESQTTGVVTEHHRGDSVDR
jgi:hypothetical protein